MSHTPGPWKTPGYIIWRGYTEKPFYPIHAAKRGKIAETNRMDDARLIAAAPDLLEALQAATRCLAWHEVCHGVGMDKQAVEKARAAIAKATEGTK